MGAGDPPDPGRGEVWEAYIRAKGAAEEDLRRRDALDWLILRPGRLTDDPPTGVGQMATPLVTPAIGNAIAQLTGTRLRHAPFTPERVKKALA